jgi:hypothetical protein
MGRGPWGDEWDSEETGDEWDDWLTLARALASLEGAGSPWADELLAILAEEDTVIGWDVGQYWPRSATAVLSLP